MAGEEIEYESDPEEAKLSLKLRRREASDDEEEEQEVCDRRKKPQRRIDDSDGESVGAAAEYEEELAEEEEDYGLDEEYAEEEVEEDVEYEERDENVGEAVAVEREEIRKEKDFEGERLEEKKEVGNNADKIGDGNNIVADGQHEEERKEIEPFAVPTAGAFYMHDDRFRDNAGGRHRRTFVGRKLWESKDDRKWGHDKFEELTIKEKHHEMDRRGYRGRFRGRGRNRDTGRGPAQGNRPREYTINSSHNNSNNDDNNNSRGTAPKGVRGRGPRRYQRSFKKNDEMPIVHYKYLGKSAEKHSNASSRRTSEPAPSAEPNMVLPNKQVASNLSSASPPFYPTYSSAKDNTVPPKKDVQVDTVNRNSQQSVGDEEFTIAQSTATIYEKNIVDSIGIDKLSIGDSLSMKHVQPHLRGQGRGPASFSQMAYQSAVSKNEFNKVSSSNQQQSVRRNPGQSRAQQLSQRLTSEAQAFSPPKAAGAVSTLEPGELKSDSELKQSKSAMVAKGKGIVQGNGKASFLYAGAQGMGTSGSTGSGHSDQNFPTFLPVMQFGGQHPGGIGVPAVGMAFPGYVGQPQLGLGSSEMTWLPVLASAAGALGATYCPPYITVDSSFNARPSGQTSSIAAASSKENNAAKAGNDWKPAEKPELANNDLVQRQKNPRRYTEMKFDQ